MTQLTASPNPADKQEWIKLVSRLDANKLAHRFLEKLQDIEGYRNSKLGKDAIVTAAQKSFTLLLKNLAVYDPEDIRQTAIEIGTSRARAEVPLDALMSAIRTDYQVIWESLIDNATVQEAALIIRHTASVWEVVNSYANQTREAYLLEERQRSYDRESYRRSMLAELVGAEKIAESRLRFIAKQLDLEAKSFTVVAARSQSAETMRALLNKHRRPGQIWCTVYFAETLLLILPENLETAQLRKTLESSPVGLVTSIGNLNKISGAAELARILAQKQYRDNKANTVHEMWPELAREVLEDSYLRDFFKGDITANFSSKDKEVLLPTIKCFLQNGSIATTAEQMFCHRNTVTNRLHRFAELTGFDVTVPHYAAQLILLLSK